MSAVEGHARWHRSGWLKKLLLDQFSLLRLCVALANHRLSVTYLLLSLICHRHRGVHLRLRFILNVDRLCTYSHGQLNWLNGLNWLCKRNSRVDTLSLRQLLILRKCPALPRGGPHFDAHIVIIQINNHQVYAFHEPF